MANSQSTKKITAKRLASIPVDNTRCRLLELCPELRNRVYDYVLAPKGKYVTIAKTNPAQPPFLRTCRTIRSEASGMYYMTRRFHISIKDFDSSLLGIFHRQVGKPYRKKVQIQMSLTGKSTNWGNLLVWLKAYHEGKMMAYTCKNKCGGIECCKASMAFDVVRRLGGILEWEELVKMLEVFKMATEQKRKGTWHWT